MIQKFLVFALLFGLGFTIIGAKDTAAPQFDQEEFKKALSPEAGNSSPEADNLTPPQKLNLKTASGVDKLCLAIDIQKVKQIIAREGDSPDSKEAVKAAKILIYHLQETSEGESLTKVLLRQNLSLIELSKAIYELETQLKTKMRGEEKWAFEIGAALSNIYLENKYGTPTGAKEAVKELFLLSNSATVYASTEEITFLKSAAKYSAKANLTTDDFEAIKLELGKFLNTYFEKN